MGCIPTDRKHTYLGTKKIHLNSILMMCCIDGEQELSVLTKVEHGESWTLKNCLDKERGAC